MKIVLATDGTACSEDAINSVKSFSLTEIDSIKIVSVIDMALPVSIDLYGGFVTPNVKIEQTIKENANKILSEASEKIRSFFGGRNIDISTDVLFAELSKQPKR